MRLLVLSDLHREIWKDHGPAINLAVSRPDIVRGGYRDAFQTANR